jgi:hypothetical protein
LHLVPRDRRDHRGLLQSRPAGHGAEAPSGQRSSCGACRCGTIKEVLADSSEVSKGGGDMRFEVKRTGWVDWNFGTGDSSGLELVLWPALLLLNVLVWLPHRARGRGWTLHVYDGPDRQHARERFRTRAEAEAALAARGGSTASPPAGAGVPARTKGPQTADRRLAGPAAAPGDVDVPFRRGPSL